MKKTLQIALSEFLSAVRSKAFIIGALAVPFFSGTALLVTKFAAERKDTTDKPFAVIDQTGELGGALLAAAERRGDMTPLYRPELIDPGGTLTNERLLGLSERVRAGELFAFVIIDSGLIEGETGARIRYYTQTPTYMDLPNWIEYRVGEEITRLRFDAEGLDRRRVEDLVAKPDLQSMGLLETDDAGNLTGGVEENPILFNVVPVIMVFLMFVMLMTSAPVLLTTALEEKTNKISEFLVSAVSPFQLMMGKLLSAIGTSMVLAALYLGAASAFAAHYGVLDQIPPSLFLWFFFFLALSVMIYGSACVAIGSVCSEIRDAQSLMMPVTLLIMIPVLLWQPVLQAPSGAFARAVSFFPPATPVLLLLRNAIPPGLPWWELALGTLLCILFMIFTVWAAAKIFRIGILAQGQTPTIARLIRWVFSK